MSTECHSILLLEDLLIDDSSNDGDIASSDDVSMDDVMMFGDMLFYDNDKDKQRLKQLQQWVTLSTHQEREKDLE